MANGSLSPQILSHVHAQLTPIIRSNELTFRVLMFIVRIMEERALRSHNIDQLGENFRDASNALIALYRLIERQLGISITDSPIALM